MPNGESREGLEDVLERERQYVGRAVRDMSVEEMIAEMRATVIRTTQPTLTLCLLYTSPSPRDGLLSRMPSSA